MSCCDKIIKAASLDEGSPCECVPTEFPFACSRHPGCPKNEHYFHLCKTRLDYYLGYEQGKSPCYHEEGHIPQFKIGLGDLLAWLIRIVTFGRIVPCSTCNSRKARLNSRFPLWPICWPWRKK